MTKQNANTSSLVQGSHLRMAVKLLKGENNNLEKIIILLKTENQNMQRRLKEMQYQNDRFKVTQNQLKTELKREKERVRYLHNMNKKYERTLQKKEAEGRQMRREARREEMTVSPETEHTAATRRPAPPQRSDSFKKNRDLVVAAALKDKEKSAATSNTGLRRSPSCRSTTSSQSSEDLAGEWEDVTDVLGFLNAKVNQFERLLMESGGSTGSGKSGYSSPDSMASGM